MATKAPIMLGGSRTSLSVRARAQKQERLLASVESLGDNVIRQFAKAFEQQAIKAIGGGDVAVAAGVEEKIVSEMADLMLLGFVKRYRMERQQTGITLSLSFSREVAKIAKGFDLDLDGIRNSFLKIARPKVHDSVRLIEDRINGELRKLSAKQQPTAIATRQLRRRFVEMGISPKNPVLAETLVRTHSQFAFAAAQYQLDQDDPDDVIWGYTYVTVGNNRVRDEHAALDGMTRPKDDPIWQTLWPPNGWNCRCQLIPLVSPAPVTKAPADVTPQKGFDFNPGTLT